MSEHFGEFVARLTDNARTSLQHAESIARGQSSPYIGTEHLLLGVLAQGSSVGAKLLADAGVTLQRAELALNLSPKTLVTKGQPKGLSETAMLTLKMAYDHARELHQEFLGTEHILYSILRQKGARGTVLLRHMSADVEQILEELEGYLERQSNDYEEMMAEDEKPITKKRGGGILGRFGTDLTDRARSGKLDVVIGRDSETDRLVTILSRRTKNNPVLIGEPGVGKTAIVEGLAQRIVSENVPEHLLDRRIVQLDLAAMVAGTKYRGEFEERLTAVIDEVQRSSDVIVFIDELHLLVGAGSAEGAMDAANILKPALARGELRLIGATTVDEYRKHIEKDSALERRLQSIVVKEPSLRDSIAIVRGLKTYFESHHGVEVSDEIAELAVRMADRYVSDRFMPDKAIDVLDEAAAIARVTRAPRPSATRELRREQSHLETKIDDAVADEDYERAALYKMRLSQVRDTIKKTEKDSKGSRSVMLSEQHIARAVSAMTGVPVEKVQASELRLLKNLEKKLSRYVISQPEAIEKVARAIRRSRSGIASSRRPIGSFIFMGPTGVGKTELARVLAREVFGSDDSLIKIDMSEFAEKHTTSRLVGAPAGYVGYEDGGKLTDKIRRQPYSVVLFDEIEKAHPDVFNMLLQLLEDGALTDAQGRSVSFSNAIIILTSNLGSEAMQRESALGFHARDRRDRRAMDELHSENAVAATKQLRKFMKPELINRFDAIVTFRALTRRDIGRIFERLVDDLKDRLMVKGLGMRVSPNAKRWLIDRGFDEKNGARPLRRAIEDHIEHAIAEKVLAGEVDRGDILSIERADNELSIEVVREAERIQA